MFEQKKKVIATFVLEIFTLRTVKTKYLLF